MYYCYSHNGERHGYIQSVSRPSQTTLSVHSLPFIQKPSYSALLFLNVRFLALPRRYLFKDIFLSTLPTPSNSTPSLCDVREGCREASISGVLNDRQRKRDAFSYNT